MDKALQRQQTRERVKRYRNKQNSVTKEGSVTKVILGGVKPICVNVKQAAKLLLICDQLEQHHALDQVRYGIFGPTMESVKTCLT